MDSPCLIALYHFGKIVAFAAVDRADFDAINKYRWNLHPDRYATTGKSTRMHRLITGGALVDHANGDGLDNRRENLRPCSEYQNRVNRRLNRRPSVSGFKGVSWHRRTGKWRARIGIPNPAGGRGRMVSLGYYDDPEEAHKAYVRKAIELYGEFANDGHGPARNPDV